MGEGRFSSFVESELRRAGWFPGRRIAEQVRLWTEKICGEYRFTAFPPAVSFLEEFGGLSFDGGASQALYARLAFQLDPTECSESTYYAEYVSALGVQLFPVGHNANNSDLMIGSNGTLFSINSGIVMLVGEGPDSAMGNLVRGGPFPELLELPHA